MSTLELTLLLLAAVLISAVIAQFVQKIALPLIQIVLGIFIALFASNVVTITFDSNLFLVVFIAPLLYDEARRINKTSLLRNIKPILGLAIGLVVVSTFAIGAVVHWLIPAIPFAAAAMLGAALGPTDAVAVSSLPKDLNIEKRSKAILDGESLLNDATGIVAFQFALAAAISGSFNAFDATLDFIVLFFGGMLIGGILAALANIAENAIRRGGLESTTFHVLFDVFLPFIIYLSANAIGVSGIIAVVIGGLIRSFDNGNMAPAASKLTIASTSVWETLTFALNGIVFVLLGTQIPHAMSYTFTNPAVSNLDLLAWIFIITAIMLVIRFIWLAIDQYAHNRKDGKPFFCKSNMMNTLIMTVGGAKGAVTMAVMFTIPVLATSTSFFPERTLLIFLACGVIVVTLILSNVVLPLFVPKKTVAQKERETHENDVNVSIDILRNVTQELIIHQTPENAQATAEIVEMYNQRIAALKDDSPEVSTTAIVRRSDDKSTLPLRLEALDWERSAISKGIQNKTIEPLVGYRCLKSIDQRERALLRHSRRFSPSALLQRGQEAINASIDYLRKKAHDDDGTQAEAERLAQQNAYTMCVKKLKTLLKTDTYPTEVVSTVLLDYQQMLGQVRAAKNPASINFRRTQLKNEVEQRAIALELEGIREAYDAGTLSRLGAKRLREDVNLMQVGMADFE